MSDALDKEFQDLAIEMLGEFGEQTNFINGRRTKNNVTGELSGTETNYTLGCLQTELAEDSIDGTLIKRGDVALISSSERQPLKGDRVEIDGEYWNILAVQKIRTKPNGRTAAYELLCRI